jgi:hypothetical protein
VTIQLQIVILSRDRPIYIKEAIDSIVSQTDVKISYELIISDNSEKEDVNDLFDKYYSKKTQIKYLRRRPILSSFEHFHKVINEFNAKYSMIFHDDDILHPEYLKNVTPYLINNSNAAISTNAIIFQHQFKSGKKTMHHFKDVKIFEDKKVFLNQYLPGNGGIAPFSGYIFNTSCLQSISLNSLISGKHSDVALLAALLDYGSIVWIPSVSMYYRVHNARDSSTEIARDRLTLLKYMFSNGIDRDSKSVKLYKIIFWFNWLRQKKFHYSNFSSFSYRVILKFVIKNILVLFLTSYFWKLIYDKFKARIFMDNY